MNIKTKIISLSLLLMLSIINLNTYCAAHSSIDMDQIMSQIQEEISVQIEAGAKRLQTEIDFLKEKIRLCSLTAAEKKEDTAKKKAEIIKRLKEVTRGNQSTKAREQINNLKVLNPYLDDIIDSYLQTFSDAIINIVLGYIGHTPL